MREFPPKLTGDLWDRGILLCGGGAMLPGLHSSLQEALGVPVLVAEHPLECIALGAGELLFNMEPNAVVKLFTFNSLSSIFYKSRARIQ